jgi:hypothetical protein
MERRFAVGLERQLEREACGCRLCIGARPIHPPNQSTGRTGAMGDLHSLNVTDYCGVS